MIKIYISGEGNSDIGHKDYESGQFIFGPITILTQNILYFLHKHDIRFRFVTRKELKRYPMTLKGKKKKEKLSSGKGHSNLAYKLGIRSQEEGCHLAILMRDSDNRKFEDVYAEISSGFQTANFKGGIPAVPCPKSEAWLICCLFPEKSHQIERIKEEMKELLERIIIERGVEPTLEIWNDIAMKCQIEKIQAHSFCQYVQDLKKATQYLF